MSNTQIGMPILNSFDGKTIPLDDLCISITDCPHSTPKWSDDGAIVIRNFNIKTGELDLSAPSFTDLKSFEDRIKRAKPKPGDIIITREAPMGEVCIIPKGLECCLGQRMVLIKVNQKKISSQYLLFALQSDLVQKQINKSDRTGSIVSNLCLPDLRELEVPILENPSGIAATLKAITDKIKLNKRINAELEAMAKTLYDYWFVQFDFPDANGKPYKTVSGKMVYDPTLKRKIPEGWEVTTIGKIAKTVLGGTPSTGVDEYWDNAEIPWLSSAETASFPVITSEQKITQKGIANSAANLLPKGTVVISIVRYIRPSILGIDAATNQSVVGIKECARLKSSFIYPYFCSEVPRLMALRTGAQQPHINKGVIDASVVVLPPDNILKRYYEVAEPIFNKVMKLAFENHELISLRDWLLPMLMNGQVTVK